MSVTQKEAFAKSRTSRARDAGSAVIQNRAAAAVFARAR